MRATAPPTPAPTSTDDCSQLKRLLFLSYHFPPVGGAGVQRSVKFIRHLPEFGYQPVVVTGAGAAAGRWVPPDASLMAEVPERLAVERLPSQAPTESTGWRRRAERLLRVPPPFARWWVDGVVEAGAGVPDVDVIYASMSPFETAVAAARLARELGKPWVADLRDPWALDEVTVYPTGIHRRLEARRMSRLLASASAVIMNTEEAARAARALPGLAGPRIHAIPNGWDAGDFEGPAPAPSDTLTIVHTGYLHTAFGLEHRRSARLRTLLAGAESGVDFLPRSHVYLLRALDRLIADNPAARSQLQLHLAGVLSPDDRRVIDEFPYPELVHVHGYLPHTESVRLVRSAGLLFLPMHDLPPGRRARIVPGKAYEYLASLRPILAAVPDGDARDLMAASDRVQLCRPTDVGCVAAAIARELLRTPEERAGAATRADVLAGYERRELTRRLAEVLDAAA